jgi:Gpi18-like mannosyltransferase
MQRPSNRFTFPFLLWLFFRVLDSIVAALFSSLNPVLQIEKDIPLWPPALDPGLWLNRVFLAPWLRWDAKHYIALLEHGYVAGDGGTSFHPLYILFSKPLHLLGIDPLFSLLIVSSLSALVFFWIFYKLADLDWGSEKSSLALMLLATFPISLILFAPYTESLFLLFSTLALYEMRKRNWMLTALAILLASLARQQGVFLIFPVLWYIWEDSGRSLRGLVRNWQSWLAAAAAPSGLLIWAAYRIGYLHEGALEYGNLQGFIYSALLSPSAKVIYSAQSFMWPWNVLWISTPRLFHSPDIQDLMTYGIGIGFLVLFALAWKHMNVADRIYCAVIVFISFSISSGPIRIYLSLPRHLLVAVPVFIGLAAALEKPWQRATLFGIQFFLQVFMLFLYVGHYWIP